MPATYSRVWVIGIALVVTVVFGRSTRRAWLAMVGLRKGTVSKLEGSLVILLWLATLLAMCMVGCMVLARRA